MTLSRRNLFQPRRIQLIRERVYCGCYDNPELLDDATLDRVLLDLARVDAEAQQMQGDLDRDDRFAME